MKINLDDTTRVLRTALNILFLHSPVRTAFGAIIGFVLHGFVLIGKDSLDIARAAAENLAGWHFTAFGITFINIPNVSYLVKKRNKFPENIQQFFDAAEEMKKSKQFTKAEIKTFYNAGLNRLLEELAKDSMQTDATSSQEQDQETLDPGPA